MLFLYALVINTGMASGGTESLEVELKMGQKFGGQPKRGEVPLALHFSLPCYLVC